MVPVPRAVRGFWGETIDLSRIRVADSPFARLTGRAFVTHDTIHWPGPWPLSPTAAETATIVHELAHCWQHQTGRWQLLRGLVEQTLYTLFGWWLVKLGRRPLYDPYDYGGPAGVAAAERLTSFRLEAQAAIIEHGWWAAVGRARSVGGRPLIDEAGRPTPYAHDLERLCRGIGLRAGPTPERP